MARRADNSSDSSPSDNSENDQKGSSPGKSPVKSSHIIEEHVDLGVPREVAFDQWTRYRELSQYSKHESAETKREDRVHFSSKIGPSSRQWDADIVEQIPPKRIAWRSVGGAQNMGTVTFHRLDDRLTRLMVQMEYHPRGAIETIGNFLRMQRRRVRKDLRLFKHFIELKGEATGKGAGRVEGSGLRQETDERLAGASGDDEGADEKASSEQSSERRAS
jgi:uncharacterized membrane protein